MYGWRAENKGGGEICNQSIILKSLKLEEEENQKGDSHVGISAKLLYRKLKPFTKPLTKRGKKLGVSIQANYIQAPRKGNNFLLFKKNKELWMTTCTVSVKYGLGASEGQK